MHGGENGPRDRPIIRFDDRPTTPISIDGRSARAERTRQAVIDAHIALIRDGELKPTGAQIAERARVSLRSLWGHFGDLETLFSATGAELMRRQDDAHEPVDPSLPLAERIDRYCRQRAERSSTSRLSRDRRRFGRVLGRAATQPSRLSRASGDRSADAVRS